MAAIVLVVIITMAIVLGAELGPKPDPTTTTYTPRPEWYFYFLFELLRVVKPPQFTDAATIGIPTVCLILLILLPFYDRGPERRPERRPVATTAGILTIAAMAYLTYLGAVAGSPTEIDMKAPSTSREPRCRSTRRASSSLPSRGAWPATRSGRTGTAGPARTCRRSASDCRARRSRGRWSTQRRPCPRSPVSSATTPRSSTTSSTSSRSSAEDLRWPPAPSRRDKCGRCSTASPASTTG